MDPYSYRYLNISLNSDDSLLLRLNPMHLHICLITEYLKATNSTTSSQLDPMDPYRFIKVSVNSDGSLVRLNPMHLHLVGTGEDSNVHSHDLPLNPARNTTLRAFIPKHEQQQQQPSSGCGNLPVIIYFHGGGFVLFGSATAPFHALCVTLASDVPAVVLSVDYRLAPEHRLPAAYDDAEVALLWARSQALDPHPWLARADFSRCFLMGSSADGNIALHAAIRARYMGPSPARVVGLILDQPFFGGVERTESEVRMEKDRIIPLPVNDLVWELSLPEGADRDHEYCNPEKLVEGERRTLRGLPRCMVRGHAGDPLIDRQRRVVRMLEEEGVSVVARLDGKGYHAIESANPIWAAAMTADVKGFVSSGAISAIEGRVGGLLGARQRL